MPYTTFSDGSVLTASQVNTNFRDQVITTCTSGTRPSGTDGQMIYETDTDLLYVYNGGWVRFGAGGGWTSYTPTLTQSSAVTKTITYAKYEKIGRQDTVNVALSATGTGVANNSVTVTMPFTIAGGTVIGSGYIFDASGVIIYPCITEAAGTTVQFVDAAAAVGVRQGQTGASFSVALATGDIVSFCASYEATT
jgi:hypothetical protein